jgi:hypothetical protein
MGNALSKPGRGIPDKINKKNASGIRKIEATPPGITDAGYYSIIRFTGPES